MAPCQRPPSSRFTVRRAPQLGTAERVHAVNAILEPPHVQQAMRKIGLIPSQCETLRPRSHVASADEVIGHGFAFVVAA